MVERFVYTEGVNGSSPLLPKMMILIITGLILFLYFNLHTFHLYKDLLYKGLYLVGLTFVLITIFYSNMDYFLIYLSKFLNNYIIIKDFQDIISVYVNLSMFLALFFDYIFFIIMSALFYENIKTKTEHSFYQKFLILYSICFVVWITKQDLFFSNWEIFLANPNNLIFDIQPDFYIFFINLAEDFFDLFCWTIFYASSFLFFYKSIKLRRNIKKIRIYLNFLIIIYLFYFFALESNNIVILFFCFSFFLTECVLFTYYFLIELKKNTVKITFKKC